MAPNQCVNQLHKPFYITINQYTPQERWKSFGNIELYILKSGVFIFKFENGDVKQRILEMGPWSYFDKPLLLKPWSPTCSYERDAINTIPIWIRLPHLKLHLWSAKSLSKIPSAVGIPLFTDKMTATKQRLAYARICVEIEAGINLPQEININLGNGNDYVQKVEYEWLPAACELCKAFGHKTTSCIKHVRRDWRPKVKQANEEEIEASREDGQEPTDGDWQQVRRHGKEIIVDSTPPPCDQPDNASHVIANCSTSNAYEVLPIDNRLDEKGEVLAIFPSIAADCEPLNSSKKGDEHAALPSSSEEDQHQPTTPRHGREVNKKTDSPPLLVCSPVPLNNHLLQKLSMVDEVDKKNKKILKGRESRKKREGSGGTPGSHSS